MPDLIRHPVFLFLDSGVRRNDKAAASRGECTQREFNAVLWLCLAQLREGFKPYPLPAYLLKMILDPHNGRLQDALMA
jgi:hypothetical protein